MFAFRFGFGLEMLAKAPTKAPTHQGAHQGTDEGTHQAPTKAPTKVRVRTKTERIGRVRRWTERERVSKGIGKTEEILKKRKLERGGGHSFLVEEVNENRTTKNQY
jgi:hypothetical protein